MKTSNLRTFIYIILISLVLPFHSFATGDSTNYLTAQDTVLLEINTRGQKIFKHELAKGQTLFSLSRFYGLDLNKFYDYNPQARTDIPKIGNFYAVPIPNKAIIRKLKEGVDPKDYTTVCYVVKKGDTMYGVAKRNFRLDVKTLMDNNNMTEPKLVPGQKIHVGWMKPQRIDRDWQYPGGTSGDIVSENKRNKSDFLGKDYKTESVEQRGKVQWDNKDNFSGDGLYCLHNYAIQGSIIRFENTFTKKVVYAKVVGRVPMNYDKYVVAVVSKDIASALKAIDSQFFVVAEYFRIVEE